MFLSAQRFIINAHRGDINATDGFPEDTLEAFRSAALKGARMAKCDCQLSSDGTWYLMHDVTVDRTTNGTGHINTKTDSQVNALNIDGGLGYRSAHSGLYHPPTLSSVLGAIAPYGMILELECKDGASEATLATYVLSAGYRDSVIITASSQVIAQAIKGVDSGFVVMTATNWPESDILEAEITGLTLATVESYAPKPFMTYIDASNYGATNDATNTRTAWNAGARIYAPLDLNAAMAEYRKIMVTDAVEAEATDLNSRVATLEGAGGGSGVTYSGASVTHSASQNVTNNTATALAFNTEEWDTSGYHDNTTNNSRLVAPVTGKYRVTANIEYPSNASGIRDTNIRLNGSTNICRDKRNPASSGSTAVSLSRDVSLTAGDYVECVCTQSSGSTLSMGVNGNSPFFQIALLPGS